MAAITRQWGKPGPLLGAWVAIPDPFLAEILAFAGFDYLCIDMQHGLTGEDRLPDMIRATGSQGALPFVRVPTNSPASIMKALDSGARGVVVPLINTREEAAMAADACRYPPVGSRSYGPIRARIVQGNTLEDLNKVACIVQVETSAGYDNLEAIAATPGIDAIYIGPSDLALSFGESPAHPACHETMRARIERVRDVCKAHGIASGIHCLNGKVAAEYRARGFDIITTIVDSVHLARTVGDELRAARSPV